ncbi:hypothetical protein GQ42DRAFT_162698 [Ramicandelaber brevisporus]|nr:hypothetical protein GQ42DRAFT_162698 [Ramicandelaber brevisporus]
MFDSTSSNIQYGSAFAVFLIWGITTSFVNYQLRKTMSASASGFNRSIPRSQYSALTGIALRAYESQADTLEQFVFFAFGMLMNGAGNGNLTATNIMTVAVAGSRLGSTMGYLYDWPKIREFLQVTGWAGVLGLYILPFATPN